MGVGSRPSGGPSSAGPWWNLGTLTITSSSVSFLRRAPSPGVPSPALGETRGVSRLATQNLG